LRRAERAVAFAEQNVDPVGIFHNQVRLAIFIDVGDDNGARGTAADVSNRSGEPSVSRVQQNVDCSGRYHDIGLAVVIQIR
jgi:hypothetical protein